MRQPIALCIFVVGILFLSARYYVPTSLERPVLLSILTLLWTGLGLALASSRWSRNEWTACARVYLHSIRRLRSDSAAWQLWVLPLALVARAFLLRSIAYWPQCTIPGAYAFIPVALLLADRIFTRQPSSYDHYHTLLTTAAKTRPTSTPLPSPIIKSSHADPFSALSSSTIGHVQRPRRRHILFALAWAVVASRSLIYDDSLSTGLVCPSGSRWPAPGVAPQLLVLVIDTIGFYVFAERVHGSLASTTTTTTVSGSHRPSARLHLAGSLFLAALTTFFLLCLSAPIFLSSYREITIAPLIRSRVIRSLLEESLVAGGVVLSAMYLVVNANQHHGINNKTTGMTTSSLTILGSATAIAATHLSRLASERALLDIVPGAMAYPFSAGLGVLFFTGALVLLVPSPSFFAARDITAAGTTTYHRRHNSILLCLLCLSILLTFNSTALLFPPSSTKQTAADDIASSISRSRRQASTWLATAQTSTSLSSAVQTYRLNHGGPIGGGLPPPPNFDKWYAFATRHKSPIIDTFDQIASDLSPFWAFPPAELRARTSHLLQQAHLGIGGLRIRNGSVDIDMKEGMTPGTHRWMMEGWREMIAPFAEWLPDMDVAFNLDDESRVAVAWEETARLRGKVEDEVRGRMKTKLKDSADEKKTFLDEFTPSSRLSPPWSDALLSINPADPQPLSPFFATPGRNSIYDHFITPTCDAASPARRYRWTSALFPSGEDDDDSGIFITTAPATSDPCTHPFSSPYLHGFLASPGAFAVTRPDQLMPVFSQARAEGFSDILVPSPWNFMGKVDIEDEKDVDWKVKKETVFWRGGMTDGISRDGRAWSGFMRARFVNLARRNRGWDVGGGDERQKGRQDEQAEERYRPHPHLNYHDDDNNKIPSFPPPPPPPLTINVSFVGPFTRCYDGDCQAATETFYSPPSSFFSSSSSSLITTTSSSAPNNNNDNNNALPPSIDFQHHWLYRHLIDLDGAGFSGRFIPFLRSNSAVYRATLFRTWYDERVFAWTHYVPLDVSLRGVWGVLDFVRKWGVGVGVGGGGGEEEENEKGGRGSSKTVGSEIKLMMGGGETDYKNGKQGGGGEQMKRLDEAIAHQGSEWARKALRREDMQVYMFRLLLEWGRLVDDLRNELGYTGERQLKEVKSEKKGWFVG